MLELLDAERPDLIVNFAAQSEAAAELGASRALVRDQLRRAGETGEPPRRRNT